MNAMITALGLRYAGARDGSDVPPDPKDFDDADLPGLESETEAAETGRFDDADLPGLDEPSGGGGSAPSDTPGPDWDAIDRSLDEWKGSLDRAEAEGSLPGEIVEGAHAGVGPEGSLGTPGLDSLETVGGVLPSQMPNEGFGDLPGDEFLPMADDGDDAWTSPGTDIEGETHIGAEGYLWPGPDLRPDHGGDGEPRADSEDVAAAKADLRDIPGLEDHGLPRLTTWGRRLRLPILGGLGILALTVGGQALLDSPGDVPLDSVPVAASPAGTPPPTTETMTDDTTAGTEAPPSTPPPEVAVFDPANLVTTVGTDLLVDLNGDTWVALTLGEPWIAGPPPVDTAFNLIVNVGVDVEGQVHGTRWTLYDGATRGEGFIDGDDVKAALPSELWVTPDGRLVARIPGLSTTGGLALSQVGDSAELVLGGQIRLSEESELVQWVDRAPLGEATVVADPLPGLDWTAVEVDHGPITLVIPEG